jgi:hypothetical protein
MASTNEEPIEESRSQKRKRGAEKDSSSEESSDPEEAEYELYSKYFVEGYDQAKSKNSNTKTDDEPAAKPADKTATRKRKYVFKTESVAPKKCKKFYFLNKFMIKPRKPKIVKPMEVEEKKQENVAGKKHKLHFAKVDDRGNAYLVHRSYLKTDLFFNDEKKCNYESFKKLDLSFHVVDEIALEGLDGITLEGLFQIFYFNFIFYHLE